MILPLPISPQVQHLHPVTPLTLVPLLHPATLLTLVALLLVALLILVPLLTLVPPLPPVLLTSPPPLPLIHHLQQILFTLRHLNQGTSGAIGSTNDDTFVFGVAATMKLRF